MDQICSCISSLFLLPVSLIICRTLDCLRRPLLASTSKALWANYCWPYIIICFSLILVSARFATPATPWRYIIGYFRTAGFPNRPSTHWHCTTSPELLSSISVSKICQYTQTKRSDCDVGSRAISITTTGMWGRTGRCSSALYQVRPGVRINPKMFVSGASKMFRKTLFITFTTYN